MGPTSSVPHYNALSSKVGEIQILGEELALENPGFFVCAFLRLANFKCSGPDGASNYWSD
jgi:hypothetical protein